VRLCIQLIAGLTACCDHGNEPSAFIKCREFCHRLRDLQLLKKGFAPWNWSSNHLNILLGFTSPFHCRDGSVIKRWPTLLQSGVINTAVVMYKGNSYLMAWLVCVIFITKILCIKIPCFRSMKSFVQRVLPND
jgi:hypothetical protein